VLDGRDDFLKGKVILINKPINWTSFQVVKKIRFLIKKKYKLKKIKVGHAGTLDPLATGLLILCTGKLTKKIADIQAENKKYRGSITLGGSTPSYDLETEVNTNYQTSHITENLIFNASSSFIGEINQKPPIFSALKKNGERMYEKARRGEKVVMKSRKVKIHEFNITSINNLTVNFEITCSKGTYIRSIANDFGVKLNTGGYLSSLKRISIGDYNLSESTTIEDFEKQLFN
tara:strand:+ start:306547 stop:307242 length:696 start_codon:yes stop_codon:yes gene_type:complete